MANRGCQGDSAATEALFVDCFKDFDTVVGPSGSCVHHEATELIAELGLAIKSGAIDPVERGEDVTVRGS